MKHNSRPDLRGRWHPKTLAKGPGAFSPQNKNGIDARVEKNWESKAGQVSGVLGWGQEWGKIESQGQGRESGVGQHAGGGRSGFEV